jgi:molybdopterin-containing oxidoreductase family membrane subunit
VFIEKGIGLVLPGFIPGTLGEVYEYAPSIQELMILIGVAGAGTLVFTLFTKVAIPLAFHEEDGRDAGEPGTGSGTEKWIRETQQNMQSVSGNADFRGGSEPRSVA